MARINKEYDTSLMLLNDLILGKKLYLLWAIIHGDNTIEKLEKVLLDTTTRSILIQLKDLENSGILTRKDSITPLKAEYNISKEYFRLIPLIDEMANFANLYADSKKIKIRLKQ